MPTIARLPHFRWAQSGKHVFRYVTATHGKNSNRLKLITWEVITRADETLSVKRLADSGNQMGTPDETADIMAYDGGDDDRVICAVRTKNGKLKLISFKVDRDGRITRIGDSGDAAGQITGPPSITLSVLRDDFGTPLPLSLIFNAVRTQSHRLKLIIWREISAHFER